MDYNYTVGDFVAELSKLDQNLQLRAYYNDGTADDDELFDFPHLAIAINEEALHYWVINAEEE